MPLGYSGGTSIVLSLPPSGDNGDGESPPLLTDEITGSLTVIPVVHHEVHEGETFQSSYYDDSVNDDATISILLSTGAKYAHLVFEVSGGGDFEIAFYEAPAVTDAGTALNEYNMKRYSTEVATVGAYHTPTVVGGTLLANVLAPGGRGGNAAGGGVRSNTEWILSPSTIYVLTGTNRSGNTKPASILVQWYEESTA